MSFTDAQKTKIRYYLGYGVRFGQTDESVDQAMTAIESSATSAEISFISSTLLVDLDVIYTNLKDAHNSGRIKANVAGSIEINRAEIMQLRSEGARLAQSLAAFMNISARHNVFSSGRYTQGTPFGTSTPGGAGPPGYMRHG